MNVKLSKSLLALGLVASLGAGAQGLSFDNSHWGDKQFKSIAAGQTQDQVRSAIGAPSTVQKDASDGVTQWRYRYTDLFGYDTEFDVTFDTDGQVTKTDSVRLGD
jgi:outer membrane protein assembly factor BamE (lipoprotein component of BamABCDE complex)